MKLKHCIVIWALVGVGFIAPLSQKITDADFWWRLAAGRLMLQSHSIPTQDVFSFTAEGSRWVPHEWLSEVLIYAHYRTFGLGGVIFLRSMLVFLLALSLYLFFFRRTKNELISVGCSVALTLAGCGIWSDRPQLFSYLLLISLLRLIDRWRRGKSIWAVVPLFILWVNLHKAWIAGLAVLTVVLAEECIISLRAGKSSRIGHLILVYAAVIGALFINPVGRELVLYPLQCPGIYLLTASDLLEILMHLALLVGVVLLTFGAKARARVSEWGLALGSAVLPFVSVCHAPMFAVLAAPLIASQLQGLTSVVARNRRIQAECVPANLVALFILLPVLWAVFPRQMNQDDLVQRDKLPIKAAGFLWPKKTYGEGKLLAPSDWGGYLIFRLHPAYRVSIDGRENLYGKELIEAHRRLEKTTGDWRTDLKTLDPDIVIWPVKLPLAHELEKMPEWIRIYEDKVAVVMVKKD